MSNSVYPVSGRIAVQPAYQNPSPAHLVNYQGSYGSEPASAHGFGAQASVSGGGVVSQTDSCGIGEVVHCVVRCVRRVVHTIVDQLLDRVFKPVLEYFSGVRWGQVSSGTGPAGFADTDALPREGFLGGLFGLGERVGGWIEKGLSFGEKIGDFFGSLFENKGREFSPLTSVFKGVSGLFG